MSKQRVAKIVRYDAAHELGLVRTTDDNYWIVEGPITDDGPFRWVREASSFSLATIQFSEALKIARL